MLGLGLLCPESTAQENRPGDDAGTAAEFFELGAVQASLAEFDTAEDSYLKGVELLVATEGEFSPLLIDPYVNLAGVYRQDGQFPEAITVLEHAQHISQRNFGLFNREQESILREIGRVYQTAGDTRGALEAQEQIFDIGVRRHGDGTPEIVPYHVGLAEYYEASRMRGRARDEHEAVVEILETHHGELSPELLPTLRTLVGYDIYSGDSSSSRRRLEAILTSDAAIEPVERALSLASLGDWDLVFGRETAATEHYRDAYSALADSDVTAAAALFARPIAINFVPPPGPVDLTSGIRPHAWGEIVAEFEVSADGRARSVEIVAANPAGIMENLYRRRLRETFFRPRLVDGEPAITARVRFRHAFRYFIPEE
jgi:tetratricopeptide (TPR) repeat protein